MSQETPTENNIRQDSDAEGLKANLDSVRAVFWIVPLYAILVGIFAVTLLSSHSDSVFQTVAKFRNPKLMMFMVTAAGVFAVSLAGISIRSIQCALILHEDPFRAFAMGRFILGMYMSVSVSMYIISEWPKDKFEAPLSAVLEANEEIALINTTEVVVYEVNSWSWLFFLTGAATEFFTTLSLFLFCVASYRVLLKDQRPYEGEHFVYDITFSWKGVRYDPDASRQPEPGDAAGVGADDSE